MEVIFNFIASGFEFIRLAIGRSKGHFDIGSLRDTHKRITVMEVVESGTIGQSVEILASSAVYMGSSLHGAIIANAYGNAVIGLTDKVPKLKSNISS